MESFEIFAEMSIAMLGFSGLMVAVSDTTSIITARVKGLLFTASIAVICSVLPLTGLSIVYCSFVYIGLMLYMTIWTYSNFFRNPAANANSTIYVSLNVALLSTMIALLYSIFQHQSILFHAYLYAISITLLCSGTYFVRMVLFIAAEKEGST